MMRILKTMRKQQAVYWEAGPGSDSYGNPVFLAPRELVVRWVDEQEDITDARGQQRVSKSKVYVGEDLKPWSVLKLGRLADIPTANLNKPFSNPGASQIVKTRNVPTLDAKDALRVCYL